MTPKEQSRLQVLNSLAAEHMTLDQAAELMGVPPRDVRRILAAYHERGAAALAHSHRGLRPSNAAPEGLATDVVHLARTRYAGAGPGDDPLTIGLDSTVYETFGLAEEGAQRHNCAGVLMVRLR